MTGVGLGADVAMTATTAGAGAGFVATVGSRRDVHRRRRAERLSLPPTPISQYRADAGAEAARARADRRGNRRRDRRHHRSRAPPARSSIGSLRPASTAPSRLPCDAASGVALPALAQLTSSQAAIAWYAVPFSDRATPVESCQSAKPAPAHARFRARRGRRNADACLGKASLASSSTSVRPPALRRAGDQVVVAAPLDSAVGVWTIDSSEKPSKPISIPGLAGARGVSVGVTTDGSGIAVVAEIGCGTQSIELAIGSVAMGFDKVVEVAPSNGALAIDSEVTWIQSRQEWLVTWISAAGGGHLLARRFTPDGAPIGGPIDPSVKASVAMPTGVGDVLTFDGTSVFSDIGIGCKP